MIHNKQNKSEAIQEHTEYEIIERLTTSVQLPMEILHDEEKIQETISSIKELITRLGPDNYKFSERHSDCLDTTISTNERVSIAIKTACNYIVAAEQYPDRYNFTESLRFISRANYFYGLANGIKSVDECFDIGTIKPNTKRATERAREGGNKKEIYKTIKRNVTIQTLKEEDRTKTWKTPAEAANKIAGKLFKILHEKNIPIPKKVETLERYIVKLIDNDTATYRAYEQNCTKLKY